MKTALLMAIIVLADAAGDVFLTKGMKEVGKSPPSIREPFWSSVER
jgi:hypothetical protein